MNTSKSITTLRLLTTAAIITVLFAVVPSIIASPANDEPGPNLFIDAAVEGGLDRRGDPTIIRTRLVDINFDLLGGAYAAPQRDSSAASDLVRLNLFNNVVFTAVLDRRQPNQIGGYSWIGHLQGVAHSQVILVVKDGITSGAITLPGALYQVRYAGNGVHAIYQIDPSDFPPEAQPIPVDIPEVYPAEAAVTPMADDGSQIDVMVVYTAEARQAEGGTSAIQTLIQNAVDDTNQSYQNSGINQRLNLVHTAEVSYAESGDLYTDLGRLQGTSDGYLDDVHSLRDTHLADVVALIVENGGEYCGRAYLMATVSHGFESSAFSVIVRNCAVGNHSFAHELGHNMSARHDRYVDNTDNSPYPYNHGYVNVPDRWRTITAYNDECTHSGVSCTRLQYWSNPDLTYGGDPMGVPEGQPNAADNRKTLNNTAYTVANFRTSPSLSIAKVGSPDPAQAGGLLLYTLTIINSAIAGPASNLVVTDTVPADTSFVSASDGGTLVAGKVVSWTVPNLAGGASIARTFTVAVPNSASGQVIANTTYGVRCHQVPTPTWGTAVTTIALPPPSLSIVKTDSPAPIQAGGLLTYTLTIINAGAGPASNLVITDAIPANTSFVSASEGGTLAGDVVRWTVPALAGGGASINRTFTVTVSSAAGGQVITNTTYGVRCEQVLTPTWGTAVTTAVQQPIYLPIIWKN